MDEGTIAAVRLDKGFGFITPKGAKPREGDIFFHATALQDGLEFTEQLLHQRVEYATITTPRGPKASAVWPARN